MKRLALPVILLITLLTTSMQCVAQCAAVHCRQQQQSDCHGSAPSPSDDIAPCHGPAASAAKIAENSVDLKGIGSCVLFTPDQLPLPALSKQVVAATISLRSRTALTLVPVLRL